MRHLAWLDEIEVPGSVTPQSDSGGGATLPVRLALLAHARRALGHRVVEQALAVFGHEGVEVDETWTRAGARSAAPVTTMPP